MDTFTRFVYSGAVKLDRHPVRVERTTDTMVNEVLAPKDAAIEANAHQNFVYSAIHNGKMRTRRERGRIYIFRDSFEAWKQRLNERRKMREEERLLSGT